MDQTVQTTGVEQFRVQGVGRLEYATPFLLMNISDIQAACARFRMVMPKADIHYAVKCNADARVLKSVKDAGESFEIASYPELEQLMAIGVDPARVLFSNPIKTSEHIRAAFRAGLDRFAFDSRSEIVKLVREAPGARVYVRIRTRPKNSVVPSEGKFGVDVSTAYQLMKEARHHGLRPHGIAFHVGSQKLDVEDWGEALADAGRLSEMLRRDGIVLSMLDMGGGFPAHYREAVPELAAYAEVINTGLAQHLPYQPEKLVIEPGRALVADAGVMVATVIGIAERGADRWAHLDVGAFNGMMESLETLNMLHFPVSDSREDPMKVPYHLTGPSCDSQDTILFGVPLSQSLVVGDRVFIHTAGAYTVSYASTFNGFDIPKVYCI